MLAILALTFARIGLGAFGGGLSTIPFIHYELVASRPWLTEREFAEVVSLAQMTPGPIALNAATFVGYKLAGLAGSIVATASVAAAPLLLLGSVMAIVSRASGKWKERMDRVRESLRPVVAGMLLTAFWLVSRHIAADWRLWILTGAVLILLRQPLLKRYPQLLLLLAGIAGAVFL